MYAYILVYIYVYVDAISALTHTLYVLLFVSDYKFISIAGDVNLLQVIALRLATTIILISLAKRR